MPNEENQIEVSNTATSAQKRRIKLPEAPLPTFDGKYENWLSFKNAFGNMIGSRTDLSDIDKLHYLKAALKDDAANKIKIFAIDGVNYSKAWELLERAYEVKRILSSRHLIDFKFPEARQGIDDCINQARRRYVTASCFLERVGSFRRDGNDHTHFRKQITQTYGGKIGGDLGKRRNARLRKIVRIFIQNRGMRV